PTPGDMARELVPTTVQTAMLDLLDDAITQADDGTQRRWIINTPPQEGKSWRVCRDAALWLLLRNPDRRIIIASYQQTLAEVSTLEVRQLIEMHGSRPGHPDEDNRLGLSIDPARGAMGNWRLHGYRGGMVAAGVGSGITGRPGDVIVVDDPLADAEAADSPVMRAKVIDWWTSVVLPRLVSTSIVIIVQTRWNEEDLSGWLIAHDDPDDPRYRVLAIPAQAESDDPLGRQPGEWLVSARGRTVEEWEDIKRETTKGGIRWWFALYQQRPAPPSGDTFQLSWFDRDRVWNRPDGPPPIVVIDPADNTGSGDEAGIIVASMDTARHIYIGPDYSGHYTISRWVRIGLLAMIRHGGATLAYEKSLSGLAKSVKDGWTALYKQAGILDRLGAEGEGEADPDVIGVAVSELCHPADSAGTVAVVRSELVELWPLVDGVLAFPGTGPMIRLITPKGTKTWRAQAASPKYEHRLVSHVGNLAELEHQMSTWHPGQKSPDRMDAAVYAILLLSGSSIASLSRPAGEAPARSTRRRNSPMLPRSTRR
ncbi:MAG: terminase large subunit domain-containing protein, partial [Pseudonocardiaceae bacterium]